MTDTDLLESIRTFLESRTGALVAGAVMAATVVAGGGLVIGDLL
ncbi:hypothetical protein [Actinomyces gaoshouyii]|nr:hypothetical protein [Actinomyces gaoshouyii]